MNALSRTARLIAAFASVTITLSAAPHGVRHRRAAAQRPDRQDGARRPSGCNARRHGMAATADAKIAK